MVRLARVSAFSMCHPQLIRSHQLTRHNGGNTLKSQGNRKGRRAPPLNWVECGFCPKIELCDIYGPARAVKGLSNEPTRFGTDAVIYPASWGRHSMVFGP